MMNAEGAAPRWRIHWLPRSLVGRVFALYAVALLGFVSLALALYYRYELSSELEDAQQRAEAIVAIVAPTIVDSAVIGDYDTIRRTLERGIARSDFGAAAFIDVKGGAVRASRHEPLNPVPPAWLTRAIEGRLYDTNQPIAVGGRDYGVLRLSFAPEVIASSLWRKAQLAFGLAMLSMVAGLVMIRLPLKRWLGAFDRLASFEEQMVHGRMQPAIGQDAPLEFQRTFAALNRAAESMQAQREQAAVTLGAIGDAVLTLDAHGRVLLANPAAAAMLGVPVTAIVGRTAHALMPALFGGGEYRPWRGRRGRLEGSPPRMVDSTLSPITDAEGAVQGHVLACRDVTEQHALDLRLQEELRARRAAIQAMRRALELHMPGDHAGGDDDIEAVTAMLSGLVERLQERGEQLDAIFSLSPDGFVSFDGERRVQYVSPAFAHLTGIDAAETAGLGEGEFLARLAARCRGGAAALPSFEQLAEPPQRDGGRRRLIEIERPHRVLEIALQRADDQAVSQVLHLRDVTHETEVDQMKSEFLSTAAHELRTPMTSIYGFTELMMMRELAPARQRELIERVHRQTGNVIAIVNELLDLSRIEARRGKDFEIETLALDALLLDVVADFKPPGARHAPVLGTPQRAMPIRGDRSKLRQALNNVLSNAYKYSPDGGAVEVDYLVDTRDDGTPVRAGLRVRDHGIGMTPQQLARVCERFYRADTSGAIPGTGLGMSIVKEIVELHGGDLALQSTAGEGTEVTLWLPLHDLVPAAPPVTAPADRLEAADAAG